MSQFTGSWANPARDGEYAEDWALRVLGAQLERPAAALDESRYRTGERLLTFAELMDAARNAPPVTRP